MFAPVRGVAVAGEAEIMALPGVREVNEKRVLLTLLFGGGSQLQLEACTGTWRTRHHVRLPTGSCSIPYALPQHLERGLLRDKVRTGRPASGSGQHLVASSSMPRPRPFSYNRRSEREKRKQGQHVMPAAQLADALRRALTSCRVQRGV